MERGNEPRDEGGTKKGIERTRKVSIQNMYVLLVLIVIVRQGLHAQSIFPHAGNK